ncbi:MAG: hypothetical protein ACM3YM_03700 [Sphingomonadales bacterium]
MANSLGDLMSRIIDETDRDDLGSGGALSNQLALCIERAIEFYSDEAFWFNRAAATATTANGSATVPLPSEIRAADTVSCNGCALRKVPVRDLEYRTESGRPSLWAMDGDAIRLWPTPDAAYPIGIYGVARIDPPGSDGAANAWTTEAQDLIAARTRFLLFRDVLRDGEGAQLAAQAEGEAIDRLRRETRRRAVTPLRSTGDEPWSALTTFDVNRGF